MKKQFIVILILIISFVSIVSIFIFQDSKMLKPTTNYSIVSDLGKNIPARIYSRIDTIGVGNKKENVFELVIFFNKELKMEINPIVVVPRYKIIGVPQGRESDFIRFGNKIIQISSESNIITLLNNNFYYEDNPPITMQTFEEAKISFNSFDNLKKYEKNIIIIKKE